MNQLFVLATIGMALIASSFAAVEFKPGDICSTNSQCPTGFVCDKKMSGDFACELGKCLCPEHYYLETDTCKKKSTEGQSCTSTAVCDTDLSCISSKCTKLINKKLGEACDLTKDRCLYSSCVSSKCECVTGYMKDGEKCRLKKYKESCTTGTENCEGMFQCKSSVCECQDDYVWRKVKDEDGKDTNMCEHKDVERVMVRAMEGQSCGTKSYGGTRSTQVFLSYCAEDLKCNRCYGIDGNFDVCRGTASSILASIFLLISSVVIGKLF